MSLYAVPFRLPVLLAVPDAHDRMLRHAAATFRSKEDSARSPKRTAMPQPQIGEHKKASHLSDYRFLAQGMGGGSAAEGLFESAL